jgi:hypothetical protein
VGSITHIAKRVMTPNGSYKTVYVRTPETDQAMEQFRMGALSDVEPLDYPEFNKKLDEKFLVIEAPYLMARRAARTRLGKDRSHHRVLNGMLLFRHHFESSASCREGFPQFNQLFLFFGYIEVTNRLQHQVVCETLFTRYELGLHFWLLVPRSLGEMAAQWGDSFLNFGMFPSIRIEAPPSEVKSPVSVARPTAPSKIVVVSSSTEEVVVDPSYESEIAGYMGLSDQPRKRRGGSQ